MQDKLAALQKHIEHYIIGKTETVQLAIITLLSRGHLMIEDVPGVGKTSLAHALASALDLDFRRIQFTSDILPSDITGVSVYDAEEKRFHFQKGPLFSNIVMADEINRSTPRTQSALLESMNERQVTVDNTTYPLEEPFFVIATQNPVESHGTHPLPESQLDRFTMYLSMGYPSPEDERRLLLNPPNGHRPGEVDPVLSRQELMAIQAKVAGVRMDAILVDYILSLVTATRESRHLALGVSPRGALTLKQAAKARALFFGRDYCVPDDIKRLAVPVLCHRVIPSAPQGAGRRHGDTATLIRDLVENLEVPV